MEPLVTARTKVPTSWSLRTRPSRLALIRSRMVAMVISLNDQLISCKTKKNVTESR